MRLTIDDDRETIQRYAHIRRSPRWRRRCGARCSGTKYGCTLARTHRGPHVAHAFLGRVVAVWDAGTTVVPGPRKAADTGHRAASTRTGHKAVRAARSDGTVKKKPSMVSLILWHVEEIAIGVMFLAFLWFAFGWLNSPW